MVKDKREADHRYELQLNRIEMEIENLKIEAVVVQSRIDAKCNIRHDFMQARGGMNAKIPHQPTYKYGIYNLDANLERYERFALHSKRPKESWATNLSAF